MPVATARLIHVSLWLCIYSHIGRVSSQLYVTDPGKGAIYQIDQETNDKHVLTDTWFQGGSVVGITYDNGSALPPSQQPRTHSIIYTDTTGGIYRQYLNNSQPVLMYNISAHGQLADRLDLDPTSGNVFFTTLTYVGVITPDNVHVVLLTGLGSGREIVVVPALGYLFYTDHGSKFPHIGRSFMDGSDWSPIIKTGVTWPNGLSADHQGRKLYWADGYLRKIERCSFDGRNREVLVSDTGYQFMDLHIDGNKIYVTEWTNKTVRIYEKSKGTHLKTLELSDIARLDSLTMHSDYSKQKPRSQVCAARHGRGPCSDVCLPSSGGRVTCACDHPLWIGADGRTCPGATLCPPIKHGRLEPACSRFHLETCKFTCRWGYDAVGTSLLCNDAKWNVSEPCIDRYDVFIDNFDDDDDELETDPSDELDGEEIYFSRTPLPDRKGHTAGKQDASGANANANAKAEMSRLEEELIEHQIQYYKGEMEKQELEKELLLMQLNMMKNAKQNIADALKVLMEIYPKYSSKK